MVTVRGRRSVTASPVLATSPMILNAKESEGGKWRAARIRNLDLEPTDFIPEEIIKEE